MTCELDADFTIGQGDVGETWDIPISDRAGNVIDITGATSVVLHYRIDDESLPAVDATGAVSGTAPNTAARMTFAGPDTENAGRFDLEVIVTLASGEVISYPACAGRPHLTFEVFGKS